MTFLEFKKRLADLGLRDEDEIQYIDWSGGGVELRKEGDSFVVWDTPSEDRLVVLSKTF